MTKVTSADLTRANTSAMITQLDSTYETSTSILSKMNEFIYGSTDALRGEGYNAVRAKLSLYVDAIRKEALICQNLSNNVKAANNVMLTFMDGYTVLDDKYISDIENSIEDVKAFLGWLRSYSSSNERNGTDAEISHWEGIQVELESKLNKLKQLAPTDKSAFALLDKVSEDIMNFSEALYKLKLPNYDGTVDSDQNSAEFKELLSHAGLGGEPVFYYQKGWYDEDGKLHPWKSSWGKSIASSGCGPTSMAAILATMLGDKSITPATIANKMSYNENCGGQYAYNACKRYGLDYDAHIGLSKNLKTFIKNGGMMIVAINYGGHYIAILGYDDASGKYIVCDPNNPKKRKWTYNEIAATHTMAIHIAPKGKTVRECI